MPARKLKRSALVLTALDVETKAVLRQLDRRNGDRTVDGTVFYLGQFEDWSIAVAECGPGNTSATAICMRGIEHFRPSAAMFVGVAGGLKDVKIGDVVVADKLVGYDPGKEDKDGFLPRLDGKNASHYIEQRGRTLPKSEDWKKRLNADLPHKSPLIYVGPIAAGERVLATTRGPTYQLLRKFVSDALAVEMEGRGFLEAVDINPLVYGGIVRGISDLLENKEETDKAGSQLLAADAASAAAFEILHGLGPTEHSKVKAPAKRAAQKQSAKKKKGKATRRTRYDVGESLVASLHNIKLQFQETPSTFSEGTYFQEDEVLATVGVPEVDEVLFSFAEPPDAYVRLIPLTPLDQPLRISNLLEASKHAPMLKKRPGALTTINSYGAIAYDPARAYGVGHAPLNWATQLFENGELWAMSNTMIVRERAGRPDWVPVPLLPTFVFEDLFFNVVHGAVAFAKQHLRASFPCQLELGLLKTKGLQLGISAEDIRGPIHAEQVVSRVVLPNDEAEAINLALLLFFERVYELTGFRRPSGLYGFPPGPPKV